jgi:hypothetical protein
LHPVLEARTTVPSEDEVELMSDNIEPLAIQDSKRRKSSMRRRSSVHPIMETHAIQEEPDTDPVPVFISAAVDSDVVEPAPSERRKSSMRRRSSFHPSVTSVISENPPNLDSHSMSSSAADLPVSCVSETTADCAQNESSDDMEMTGVLPVMLVSAAPAQFAVASDAAVAFAALKSPGKRVSSQKIESLVSVFEQKSQSTSVSKISALKSPPPFRGLRAEEPPAPSAAQAVSHAGPAVTATAPLTKPVVVEDKASLVRNLIKRIESNHQSIAGTPSYKGGPSSDVSTPVIQLTSASTPHSAVPCPASAAVLPSETDHSFGPFATTLTLPLPMAALATPTATTILAPAVACALDQSADTSIVQLALDCSLNASMDCSFNGSFSEARQSKPKPVIVATQADKARRDAEKKAAEVESASALRLDSEAKHKAARERRLQLEEENRRKLEEAEKAKRDREAAKQAAVKAQLDEEQRRKREEEEKRRREKESMTAALEDAKRKEQARAFQKVPAALVASSATSSAIETSLQRTVVFSPNKAASSTAEQTSISSLVAPTVVPATIFSPAKPVVASSLFGGVKSLISTVGGSFRAQPASFVLKLLIPVSLAGIFSPKLKTGTAPAAAVVHTFQAPAPVSQKEIAALGVAAVAAAQESGPTSYDISNDCNRFASLSAASLPILRQTDSTFSAPTNAATARATQAQRSR